MSTMPPLSATTLRRQIAEGRRSARDVVSGCLAAIAHRDASIAAWACHLDSDASVAPRGAAADLAGAPLYGLPVGIKDVIDTADFPTEYGSEIYPGNRPACDAALVARMKEAGAVILGKTATTEFATRRPCRTVNPLNPAHTPGGSSSGSAAAVAAGMVPLAVGTQTLGSVIRPAAYCGVAAIKPSFGLLNRSGVKILSDAVDTLGIFAQAVPDLALVTGAVAGDPDLTGLAFRIEGGEDFVPLRLALCRSPQWPHAAAHMQAAFERVERALSGTDGVTLLTLPPEYDALEPLVDRISEFEIRQSLSFERVFRFDGCSDHLRAIFDKAAGHSAAAVAEARLQAEALRCSFDGIFDGFDCIVTPSAPGEAPIGHGDTGPAIFNKIWTLLHVPCVTVPAGLGPSGLPLGLQVVARRGRDDLALLGALRLQAMLRQKDLAA